MFFSDILYDDDEIVPYDKFFVYGYMILSNFPGSFVLWYSILEKIIKTWTNIWTNFGAFYHLL
jgi:hypothetical protein